MHKQFVLILCILLLISNTAGCDLNKKSPVSWELIDVSGKAEQVEGGTRVTHQVTVKNSGGETARKVKVLFHFVTLGTYGDDINQLKPGESFTITDSANGRVLDTFDFNRYQQDYEGDGTVTIKWQENGVGKSQSIAYKGKYHPNKKEAALPSQATVHGPINPTISPGGEFFIVNQGPELWLYAINGEALRKLWTCPRGSFLGQSSLEWAADENKVIFNTVCYPDDEYNNMRKAIWFSDLQTGQTIELLENDGHIEGTWSPDSSNILIEYGKYDAHLEKPFSWKDNLVIYDVHKGQLSFALSRDDMRNISAPIWSPDSSRFAYSALLKSGKSVLVIYDITKGMNEVIDKNAEEPYFARYWSREGIQLFYQTGNWGGIDMEKHQLGYIDLMKMEDRPLTMSDKHGDSNRFTSISPDEKILLFTAELNHGSQRELWQMNLESGECRQLAVNDIGRFGSQYLWTQNSSSFYFSTIDTGFYGNKSRIIKTNLQEQSCSTFMEDLALVYPQQIFNNKMYYIRKVQDKAYLKVMDLTTGRVKNIYQENQS